MSEFAATTGALRTSDATDDELLRLSLLIDDLSYSIRHAAISLKETRSLFGLLTRISASLLVPSDRASMELITLVWSMTILSATNPSAQELRKTARVLVDKAARLRERLSHTARPVERTPAENWRLTAVLECERTLNEEADPKRAGLGILALEEQFFSKPEVLKTCRRSHEVADAILSANTSQRPWTLLEGRTAYKLLMTLRFLIKNDSKFVKSDAAFESEARAVLKTAQGLHDHLIRAPRHPPDFLETGWSSSLNGLARRVGVPPLTLPKK